ncbi:MAG: DNA translocase FtsK [Verrucomicrobiota bacterium]|nr:DNA translocase FtsK [Verrucomicrobiota bacterium]
MARKTSSAPTESRPNDVLGLVFLLFSTLLLVALLTYDRKDISTTTLPVNSQIHNWIGIAGARVAYAFFFVMGGAAYLVPVALAFIGMGYLMEFLFYFQRRWLWSGVLILCCMGFLDLHGEYFTSLTRTLNAPGPGGIVGQAMNSVLFSHFGRVGATIIFLTLYLISLLYLTNFKLGEWCRAVWQRYLESREEAKARAKNPSATPEERALEKKARELEKQARRLKDETADEEEERSGLGADLQPIPEPTVRDLSIPQARTRTSKSALPPESEKPVMEGDVISAREIAAASTAEVLGKAEPSGRTPGGPEEMPLNVVPKKPAAKKSKAITVASTPLIGNYKLPSMEFLHMPDISVKPTESKEELMSNARLMQSTLAQFDIEVALGDITKGPTITRYELHPAPGVRLEKISALGNNIAAALKAERINILAPVPGKSSVGVEVPNAVKTKVIMRDLLESEEWLNTKARIPLALGKDVYGHPIIADLAEMPHLLIAGSTGSGKSVCINSIIASLLYRFSPDQLRFVMIDPKVVELQQYNSLPHLVVPVVNDPKKVILALRWVVNEMEKRYQIFAKVGVRNIKSFNERPKDKPKESDQPELPLSSKKEKIETNAEGMAVELDEEIVVPREDEIVIPEKLSYVVVIIDELADLMLVAPADVEMAIARITQMARAAGIHCIVATQRPSVDVITGVIKANIPARIAFQVAAKVDSRTILDAMGADKLLGKGDMLYLPPGAAKLTRAQGVLITDQEIQSVVDFISQQGKPSYEMEIHQQLSKPTSAGGDGEEGLDEDEDLIQQCIEVIRSEQKASVSLMQRRLRLGYTRAARIMDELENRGIVGPSKGAEPRDILIDLDAASTDGSSR